MDNECDRKSYSLSIRLIVSGRLYHLDFEFVSATMPSNRTLAVIGDCHQRRESSELTVSKTFYRSTDSTPLQEIQSMKKEQIVSRNPNIMSGALVFAGTRVPVEILIQHLEAGDSLNEFLDDFPTVSHDQAVAYLKMTLEAVDARPA